MIRALDERHALFVEAVLLSAGDAGGNAAVFHLRSSADSIGVLAAEFDSYTGLVSLGVHLGVYIAEAGTKIEEEMRESMAAAGECRTVRVDPRIVAYWPDVAVKGTGI